MNPNDRHITRWAHADGALSLSLSLIDMRPRSTAARSKHRYRVDLITCCQCLDAFLGIGSALKVLLRQMAARIYVRHR